MLTFFGCSLWGLPSLRAFGLNFFRAALDKSFVDLFWSSLWGLPSGTGASFPQGPQRHWGPIMSIEVPNFSVGVPSGTPKAYKVTPMRLCLHSFCRTCVIILLRVLPSECLLACLSILPLTRPSEKKILYFAECFNLRPRIGFRTTRQRGGWGQNLPPPLRLSSYEN